MLIHPFNKENCVKRLLEEYHKYGKLIVAFDFDNTIYDYHNTGGDYSQVIDLLKNCALLGFELILLTTEENSEKLQWKINTCVELLNTKEILVNKSTLFPHAIKPYYNILLDDRAGLEESYEILQYVINKVIQ